MMKLLVKTLATCLALGFVCNVFAADRVMLLEEAYWSG